MFLRVVMITTLLLIATYVEAVSETLLRVNALYFLIVGTYVLTIVHVARPPFRAATWASRSTSRSSSTSSSSRGSST